ncbi:MAG TPA: sigma factor-like helix-turn-helix DNA-binding protein [Clostridia bacterium]|nr:sigma factor-like helix-turn-helix DNA-binding protein [Clostridia bacterium]
MKKEDSNRISPAHTDVCLWLDYYGELLSARQKEILCLYYDEDWSLSEIADLTNLSRQGVHDRVRRGVAKLESYETTLALVDRDLKMEKLLNTALELSQRIDTEGIRQLLEQLRKLLKSAQVGIGETDGESLEARGNHGII